MIETSNFEKAYNHFKINNQLMNESYGKGVNEKSFIELVTQRINFLKILISIDGSNIS
jgi:hypothetical protein